MPDPAAADQPQSYPPIDASASPRLAGAFPDDDARTLDSLVESHAEPPQPPQLPTAPTPAPRFGQPLTRFMTRTLTLPAGSGPVMLLPSDPNRIALGMHLLLTGEASVILVSDDIGKVQSDVTAYTMDALMPLRLVDPAHTGPVWVRNASDQYGATVTVLTVRGNDEL